MVGLLLVTFAIIIGAGLVALLANLVLNLMFRSVAAGVRRVRLARRP